MHIHIVYMGTMSCDSVWNAHVEIVRYEGVILSPNSGNIFNEQEDGQDSDTTGCYMDIKFVVSRTSCASYVGKLFKRGTYQKGTLYVNNVEKFCN